TPSYWIEAPRWAASTKTCEFTVRMMSGLALRGHVGRLYDRVGALAGVAPCIARVRNDGSDFDIVESVAEGCHGGSGVAVEHGVDLALLGRQYVFFVAVKRRERGRHALAVGLVASDAVGGVHLFATGDEVFFGPLFGGVVGGVGQGLLLLGGPGVEFFLGDNTHDDGHESVIFTAQFGALTAIGAGFGGAEPGVAQEAGDGVLLDAEVGHHPGVDDVGRRDDDAHFLVDGNNELVVDFHQVGVAA